MPEASADTLSAAEAPRYTGHGHRLESGTDARAEVERFSHFVLEVSDLGRSEAWYRDVIGMEVVGRGLTAETRPHAMLRMNTGQLFVLVETEKVEPRRPGSSSIHHGLLLTLEQYARAQERLRRYGYEIADTREQYRPRGEYSMDIEDPDGHRYQIQAYGPEAHEIICPGVGVVDCGPHEGYAVGGVRVFKEGDFFLVRTADGFLAVTRWCTHMNGKVIYQQDHWRFWCPFHGSTFDRRGDHTGHLAGVPALRLNPVSIGPDGHVLVDTDQVIERECYAPQQATPPPAPPTSTGEGQARA